MTTIAYRDGVLAADSRACRGDWVSPYEVKKIIQMKDGAVAASCGDYVRGLKYIAWLDTDRSTAGPSLSETTVIIARADGQVTIHEDGGSFDVQAEFASWGSGSPAALGAMHMGADAAKAVEIACKLDTCSGGTIIAMKCEG